MQSILYTFLYWMAIFLALNLNVMLLLFVYRFTQDRCMPTAEEDCHRDGLEDDDAELRMQASVFGTTADDEDLLQQPVIKPDTSHFRMPDFKVETSFGSGKLGKCEKSQ